MKNTGVQQEDPIVINLRNDSVRHRLCFKSTAEFDFKDSKSLNKWIDSLMKESSKILSLPTTVSCKIIRGQWVMTDVCIPHAVLPLLACHLHNNPGRRIGVSSGQSVEKLEEQSSVLHREYKTNKALLCDELESQQNLVGDLQDKLRPLQEKLKHDPKNAVLTSQVNELEMAESLAASRVRELRTKRLSQRAEIRARLEELRIQADNIRNQTSFALDTDDISFCNFSGVPLSSDLKNYVKATIVRQEKGKKWTVEDATEVECDVPYSEWQKWRMVPTADAAAAEPKALVSSGYPSYLRCLATVMKPPFPGGKRDFGFIDTSSPECLTVEKLMALLRNESDEVEADPKVGDVIVYEGKEVADRINTAVMYMNQFIFQVTHQNQLYGVKKVDINGQVCFDYKSVEGLKGEFNHLRFKYAIRKPGKQRKDNGNDGGDKENEDPKRPRSKKSKSSKEDGIMVTDLLAVQEVSLIKCWLDSKFKNMASRKYFRPWPAHWKQFTGASSSNTLPYFNTYHGYRYSLEELAQAYIKADKTVVSSIWKLIYNNISGSDDVMYRWVIRYLAGVAQLPFVRQLACMMLMGASGIGKGLLKDLMMEGLGNLVHHSKADQVSKEFNAAFANILLLVLDEYAIEKPLEYAALKAYVTEAGFNANQKHLTLEETENYASVLANTNSKVFSPENPSQINSDDRRFCFPDCADRSGVVHKEFAKDVGAAVYTHHRTEMKAWFFELLMIDLSDFDPADVPPSIAAKETRKANKELWIVHWFHTALKYGYLLPSPVKEFMSCNNITELETSEAARARDTEGIRTLPDSDRQKSYYPEKFNPLKLVGGQLACWERFYGKPWHLDGNEWALMKGAAVGTSVTQSTQLEIKKHSIKQLEKWWTSPFWLQVIPLDKAYKHYTFHVKNNFRKDGATKEEFKTQLRHCIGEFEIRLLTVPGYDLQVEFLVIPSRSKCQAYFDKVHKKVFDETERTYWCHKSVMIDPPRLPIVSNDMKGFMNRLYLRGLRSGNLSVFFDEIERVDKEYTEKKWQLVEMWKAEPVPFGRPLAMIGDPLDKLHRRIKTLEAEKMQQGIEITGLKRQLREANTSLKKLKKDHDALLKEKDKPKQKEPDVIPKPATLITLSSLTDEAFAALLPTDEDIAAVNDTVFKPLDLLEAESVPVK